MIDIRKIEQIVNAELEGSDLFLVQVNVSSANEVEVLIDGDTGVGIDSCVKLSRSIEEAFDREQEDFELTVSSTGIGQPLRLLRQYLKLVGKKVEVVLGSGGKIVGELTDTTQNEITLRYPQRMAVDGSKKKQTVETTRTFTLEEIKSTKEYIDFK